MKDYFLIKEISKAHGITKRTLDYYDKIDLLKPDLIRENGYRMYSYEKFLDLQGILLWKMMGLDSSEIKEIMIEKSPEKMKDIIQNRKKKLQDSIEELLIIQKNLNIVDKRINDLFSIQTDKIEIKHLEEQTVELLDNSEGDVKDFKALFDIGSRAFNIFSQKKRAIVENGFIFSKKNIENKIYNTFDKCYILFDKKTEDSVSLKIQDGNYACMWYIGRISELDKGIKKVCNWIYENKYILNGDVIISEHLSPIYTICTYEENDFIGEIRIPIKKFV